MKSYIYFFTLELTKWSSVILVWKSRAAKSLVVIIVSDTSSMSSIIGVKFNLEVIKHYQSRTVIHGDVIAIPYVVSTKASLALVSWYQWERWKKSNRRNDRRLICTDDLRMLTLLDPVTYNGLVLFKLCENAKKRSTMHMTQNVQKKFYTQHNTVNNAWHCVECEYFLLSIFASLGKCFITLNDVDSYKLLKHHPTGADRCT